MGGSVQVRRGRSEDADALGRLGAMLVAEHHGFDARRFLAPTPDTAKHYGGFLASQIDRADKIMLVAEQDDAVVGYVFAGMEGFDYMALRGPAGAIYDLVVDPGHRRAGIGTMLLGAALTALTERGAPRVVLSTAEHNAAAQRLFERTGFRRTMIEMTRELD